MVTCEELATRIDTWWSLRSCVDGGEHGQFIPGQRKMLRNVYAGRSLEPLKCLVERANSAVVVVVVVVVTLPVSSS